MHTSHVLLLTVICVAGAASVFALDLNSLLPHSVQNVRLQSQHQISQIVKTAPVLDDVDKLPAAIRDLLPVHKLRNESSAGLQYDSGTNCATELSFSEATCAGTAFAGLIEVNPPSKT